MLFRQPVQRIVLLLQLLDLSICASPGESLRILQVNQGNVVDQPHTTTLVDLRIIVLRLFRRL